METDYCHNSSCIRPTFDSAVVAICHQEVDKQNTVISHSDLCVLLDPKYKEVIARDTLEGMMSDLKSDLPDMSQMDDDELLRTTMSRHCQSPAAVKAYKEYLDRRASRYASEVNDRLTQYADSHREKPHQPPTDKEDKGDK